MSKRASRLAPSPTGALHLGNARTFLINWALARRNDWSLQMRIEDLDGPRVKADAAGQALDILAWLGIDWDGDVMHQSHDMSAYSKAMRHFADRNLVYSCDLTRKQIESASAAPHAGDRELHYPMKLRPSLDTEPERFTFSQLESNHRFIVPDDAVVVHDVIAGQCSFQPALECGDFVLWTKRGEPAYQLAVVVDDHRQGITDVVRGNDLLPSAARQQLLYAALGWTPPRWWHLPIVVGADGRRLAKRHGDTRIETYRSLGVPPERIIGLIASWSGASSSRVVMSATEFLGTFSVDALSRDAVVFSEEDHRWLIDGC